MALKAREGRARSIRMSLFFGEFARSLRTHGAVGYLAFSPDNGLGESVSSLVPMEGNMRSLIYAGCLAIWLVAPFSAHASIVVAYQSRNDPVGVPASETLAGVTSLSLTRGAGLELASGSTFNSRGWSEDSLAAAIVAEDYLQWGWSDSAPLALDQLTLQYDRSSSGPAQIAIRLAINDSDDFQTLFTDSDVADDSSEWHTIDLAAWDLVTSARFRLYGWNATPHHGNPGCRRLSTFTRSRDRRIGV